MSHYHVNPDRGVPDCDDQIPVFSRVGRGLRGDTYKVEVDDPDSASETHLHGYYVDQATGEVHSDWTSENINGGQLSYQYNLRPFTIPQTFTITFIYRRPGRMEWTWTTPAIPYVWSVDEDGNKDGGDGIVGSGVATLFIKNTTDEEWVEKLVYPPDTTREDYNAPEQGKPWTVNLTFGVGGDVEVPNIDDLAKVLGITVDDIRKIIAGNQVTINGVQASDILDYVDKQDDSHQTAAEAHADSKVGELSDHIHSDMGFNSTGHGSNAFGGYASVKAYVDAMDAAIKREMGEGDSAVTQQINSLKTFVKNGLQDIVDKVYGGGTVGEDGHISWSGPSGKIALGNMNVYAGGTANYIRTDADGENDVQFN